MIKMHIIGSGSKGNASIIYNENTVILVDCGITKKRLVEGLNEINLTIDDIDFAFFTHNHNDHIGGAKFIDINKCYGVEGVLDFNKENILTLFETRKFKDFEVTVLETSHDATNFCGYLFKLNREELVYITDTGILPPSTYKLIKNKKYYIFESNYDEMMLLASKRTDLLKSRILSIHGHLSNEQCAFYLNRLVGKKTKKVILAHLSEECNSDEVAITTFKNITKENVLFNEIQLKAAKQWESVDL